MTDSLGLYISVPFCRAKCTFCNFASGVYPVSAMPAYVAALRRQLASARAWAETHGLALPHQVDTIYLGGGTPSLLPPQLLTALFTAIRNEFAVDPDAEITLEAAPLQLESATLEAAQRSGVNRISFGVQSFVDNEARSTARTHSGAQALSEIARIHAAGVPHLSADLIAGLPGQTGVSWSHSLDLLAQAPLDHASVYMFELDEDSRLGAEALRGGLRFGAALLPTDDAVADWYIQACETLELAGLHQYEISNFARAQTEERAEDEQPAPTKQTTLPKQSALNRQIPNSRSRHNERYWLRRPYLGLGVDAHSMLHSQSGPAAPELSPTGRAAISQAARFAVPDTLDTYLTGTTWSEPEPLTPTAALEESWFLGLRRTAGVSLAALRHEFGAPAIELYIPTLDDLADARLLTRQDPDTVALTPRGRLLSNDVFAALVAVAQ
jgi:oxygen-independent coproporphyrinogen-3 oxidase